MRRLLPPILRCLWVAAAVHGAARAADLTVPEAAALYQRNCAACHGERGDGESRAKASLAKAPRNFTTEKARRELPRDYMIAIVRDGKHDAPMVGRKSRLSEAQMEAIVDFIRAAYMPPEPGTPRGKGREIYRTHCAACHGERGEGGTQHGTARVPGLSRTRARSGLTREDMVAALASEKHGALRAGFAKQLSSDDREAVVEYIRTAFVEGISSPGGRAQQ
jgi:mono/diheme cytochrome c family protein